MSYPLQLVSAVDTGRLESIGGHWQARLIAPIAAASSPKAQSPFKRRAAVKKDRPARNGYARPIQRGRQGEKRQSYPPLKLGEKL